jgi:glycosyltransferase involved in cell wall biosynthesis
MQKTITFSTIGLGNRGGDRVSIELANHLADDGHTINYLFPSGMNKTTFFINPKVNLIEYGPRIKQIEDFSSIIRSFFLFYAIPKSDLILANYYLTVFPILIHHIIHSNSKIFYLIQAYEPYSFGKSEKTFPKIKQWLAERTYTFGFKHICVANWIKEKVDKFAKSPSFLFSPGINHSSFNQNKLSNNLRPEASVLIFPSKEEAKGWNDFLNAISFVLEEFPDVEIIASSKGEFPINHPNIKSIQPKNDDELAELYRSSTIYVHPAWWEGCPLAPLEAMACGTPVVAARSEGILEYAVHLENCYLVNVNDPGDLAKGIITLLKDKELREKVSMNGLKTAKNYTWEKMYDQLKNIILK